jgi:pentatricopeptide repeat protein
VRVRPNEFTYAELMRAQLRAGDHARVLQLNALARESFPGRPLMPRTLNLAMRAHCAEGELRPALRLYVQMQKQGARVDTHGRHALASLCKANGQHSLAARLVADEDSSSP